MSLLAGVDYQRDAPRRLDLDHYDPTQPLVYGPFSKVTANDVTLADSAPYVALNGTLFIIFATTRAGGGMKFSSTMWIW